MRALVFWQFESADEVATAARRLRALGFRRLYAYGPRKTWALEDALRGRQRTLARALAWVVERLIDRLVSLLRRKPESAQGRRYWIGVDENELTRTAFERACVELTARGMPLHGLPGASPRPASRAPSSG